MKFKKLVFTASILCFCSCDQLKDVNPTIDEQNKTIEEPLKEIITKSPEKPITENKIPPPVLNPVPAPVPEPKLPTRPVQPKFSEELLRAVNNWKTIPKSVFPLSSVTIKNAVDFTAKGSSGEIIARARSGAGEEVVVLGIIDEMLVLSPSRHGKMRGEIAIDQTDFKQGVAYLFELRKQQRADYKRRKDELAKNDKVPSINNRSYGNSKLSRDNIKKNESSLFEDLPVPGDFGHGKFCICKDCRKKRLATKGSIK